MYSLFQEIRLNEAWKEGLRELAHTIRAEGYDAIPRVRGNKRGVEVIQKSLDARSRDVVIEDRVIVRSWSEYVAWRDADQAQQA